MRALDKARNRFDDLDFSAVGREEVIPCHPLELYQWRWLMVRLIVRDLY